MPNIKEVLGHAITIGNEKEFDVFIHHSLNDCEKEHWTYVQLGMYLIQQHDNIISVHIYKKAE